MTRCLAVAMAPEVLVNCVAPGLLEGTRATANLCKEQIDRSVSSSLLRIPADKDDCADMVITMCRSNTMTGQTLSSTPGGYFINKISFGDMSMLVHRRQVTKTSPYADLSH